MNKCVILISIHYEHLNSKHVIRIGRYVQADLSLHRAHMPFCRFFLCAG